LPTPDRPGVFVEEVASGERTINGVATSVAAFVDFFAQGPTNRALKILGVGDFEREFGGLDTRNEASYAIHQFFLNGGREAWVVRTTSAAGLPPDGQELIGSAELRTGMHALEDVDFNLLCIPRAARVSGPSVGELSPADAQAVMAAAEAYCAKRRALFIMDPPTGAEEPEEVRRWLADNEGLRHRNAALYYPRVRIPDPLDESRLRSIGASGTIAGLYARTDAERGVWKAPAGSEAVLLGVAELDYGLTDAETATLNALAVNCLRTFPALGTLCWGARTLAGADQEPSEWKYVPVRRLALFIEESLDRGSRWAVFEPNDESLWAQLRLSVGAFMDDLFRQGALQGGSPDDAYFVRCGADTTTQADIERGVLNILVGFAPLRPGEFIVISLEQVAGQVRG
jgi:phage tail sheath protein FI